MLGKRVPYVGPLHEIDSPLASGTNPAGAGSSSGAPASNVAPVAAAALVRVAQREFEIDNDGDVNPLRKSKRLRTTLDADNAAAPPGSPGTGATTANGGQSTSSGLASASASASSSPGSSDATAADGGVGATSLPEPDPKTDAKMDPKPHTKPAVKPGPRLFEETDAHFKVSGVCAQESIIWTKIKGHPYWPTQVVRLNRQLMEQTRFKMAEKFKHKHDDACVMYFGTCEVAWVSREKVAISWEEGIRRGYHRALKNRATYQTALQEVLDYCEKDTKYPRNWWCEPKCFALAAQITDRASKPYALRDWQAIGKQAEAARVCWAKMRGYPAWPVQVLPLAEAEERFPELNMRLRSTDENEHPGPWPCMFFGTGEIALVTNSSITPFIYGIKHNYIQLCERYDFFVSIGECWGFIQRNRVWPSGFLSGRLWWNDASIKSSTSSLTMPLEIPDKPKFEMIKNSVYPAGVTKPKPKLKPDQHMVCSCKVKSVAEAPNAKYCNDEACLNVASSLWCDPDKCPAGSRCQNTPFSKRVGPRLSYFYTADQRGWGLRVDEDVKAGDFIVAYVGEILDRPALERRLADAEKNRKTEYYIMDMHDDFYVDAERRGNLSRFINSSCNPNCESQKWIDQRNGQTHVGIYAIDNLRAGTEITYNYCFQDFGLESRKQKRSFVCRCRSDTCSMINPADREFVKGLVGKRIKVKWDDGWYCGKVERFEPGAKKFKVHYDDGDEEDLELGLPSVEAEAKEKIMYKIIGEDEADN